MTYQVAIKSSDVRDLRKKGVDVRAEVKLMLGGFGGGANLGTKRDSSSASRLSSLEIDKETLVIGGKPPGDVSDPAAMATWAESVEALPMPVRSLRKKKYSLHAFRPLGPFLVLFPEFAACVDLCAACVRAIRVCLSIPKDS